MPSPTLNEHVEPTSGDHPGGTYRVVGTDDETVTLLRVADADGRRRHTGEIVSVSYEAFEEFDRVGTPDGNRPTTEVVAASIEMSYWSVRAFVQQLTAEPLGTAIMAALLLAGAFGDRLLSLPDVVTGVMILVGSLGLAYIGSGRLS